MASNNRSKLHSLVDALTPYQTQRPFNTPTNAWLGKGLRANHSGVLMIKVVDGIAQMMVFSTAGWM